jgi:hypothetical protein
MPVPRSYYDLLTLPPRANTLQVEAMFRRIAARFRPTITTEQVFGDTRFHALLNAYLTLTGPLRARYDAELAATPQHPPEPTPLAKLTPLERRMLMARVAVWRREQAEALHLLRTLLERQPEYAPAWALMGEVYFLIDRLEDGIDAYDHALLVAPDHADYAARLQHARDALAGLVTLWLEPSPEEELLAEERRQRRWAMLAIGVLALVIITLAFFVPKEFSPYSLFVPWRAVWVLAGGTFVLCAALAYGRVLDPFERTMLWTGMSAFARGWQHNYPYGLIVFVTAVASMWLSVVTLAIIAFMDEEWPWSALLMMGICVLLDLALAFSCYQVDPTHWTGTCIAGGNLLVIGGLLGWWAGSMGGIRMD